LRRVGVGLSKKGGEPGLRLVSTDSPPVVVPDRSRLWGYETDGACQFCDDANRSRQHRKRAGPEQLPPRTLATSPAIRAEGSDSPPDTASAVIRSGRGHFWCCPPDETENTEFTHCSLSPRATRRVVEADRTGLSDAQARRRSRSPKETPKPEGDADAGQEDPEDKGYLMGRGTSNLKAMCPTNQQTILGSGHPLADWRITCTGRDVD
jgi:hypothetical protein